MQDVSLQSNYARPELKVEDISNYLEKVVQLEAVACKDWLTNKVDRSVTGKIARQADPKIQMYTDPVGGANALLECFVKVEKA